MKSASEICRVSIALRLVQLITDRHPSMPLSRAQYILSQAIMLAMTEPHWDGGIRSSAAKIFASDDIQKLLPPWED